MEQAVNVDTTNADQELVDKAIAGQREGTADKNSLLYVHGDLYDEDNGEFLGNVIDLESEEPKFTLPASMSLYLDGYWYVYRMDRKYKQPEVQVDTISTTGVSTDEPAAQS